MVSSWVSTLFHSMCAFVEVCPYDVHFFMSFACWNPMMISKGLFSVTSLRWRLYENWETSSNLAQSRLWVPQMHLNDIHDVLGLLISYGWKLVKNLRSVPNNLKSSIQKQLVNRGCRSLTMLFKAPHIFTIYLMKRRATSFVLQSACVTMSIAYLLWRHDAFALFRLW